MTTSFFVSIRTHKLKVWQFGHGEKILLLFHGFEESGKQYESFSKLTKEEYTLFVPDLPFHGESRWNDDPLRDEDLVQLLRYLLDRRKANSCQLIGYSMGGRPAICLSKKADAYIDRLILIAPEGLRPNIWFRLATGSFLGKFVFQYLMFHSEKTIRFAQMMQKLGCISRYRASFVEKLMHNDSKRKRSYQVWMCFRLLTIGKRQALFKKLSLPVVFIFGLHDLLIPPPGEKEFKQWHGTQTYIYPTAHAIFSREKERKNIFLLLQEEDAMKRH